MRGRLLGWSAGALLVMGTVACDSPTAMEPVAVAAARDVRGAIGKELHADTATAMDTLVQRIARLRDVTELVFFDTTTRAPTLTIDPTTGDTVGVSYYPVGSGPTGATLMDPDSVRTDADTIGGVIYQHYYVYLPNGVVIHMIYNLTTHTTKVFVKAPDSSDAPAEEEAEEATIGGSL
jgi:hypothetical protein